jgi:hypothetical protein
LVLVVAQFPRPGRRYRLAGAACESGHVIRALITARVQVYVIFFGRRAQLKD